MIQKINAQHQICAKDLPLHPFLKPIRRFDGLYPEDDEEYEAYSDFIHWFMTQEHALLLSIPKLNNTDDSWLSGRI